VFAAMVLPLKKGLPASVMTAGIGVLLGLLYLSFPDAAPTVWNTISGGGA
jgi:hypothetical protein